MPAQQGGVADNLPPLPPSLGSISGRASDASGYTPAGGGALGGRGSQRAGSQSSQRSVRRINDRSHLQNSSSGTLPTGSQGPRQFDATGRYANVGSASQHLGDRLEGPAAEPGAEAMGAAWMQLGPPIPSRNLEVGTPPRPSQPHPGRTPPREFFELGARAYTAY